MEHKHWLNMKKFILKTKMRKSNDHGVFINIKVLRAAETILVRNDPYTVLHSIILLCIPVHFSTISERGTLVRVSLWDINRTGNWSDLRSSSQTPSSGAVSFPSIFPPWYVSVSLMVSLSSMKVSRVPIYRHCSLLWHESSRSEQDNFPNSNDGQHDQRETPESQPHPILACKNKIRSKVWVNKQGKSCLEASLLL
jgi:hypothetical protein